MCEHLPYIIRHATERDTQHLWQLMRELAVFEHYIDRFQVTEEIIRQQGFAKEHPDFRALVAENLHTKEIDAMAVYYFIPFTTTARPTLFIKQFYVREALRGKGIGKNLMKVLCSEAHNAGCDRMSWKVAKWNKAAISFYENAGAKQNSDWLDFELAIG